MESLSLEEFIFELVKEILEEIFWDGKGGIGDLWEQEQRSSKVI